MSNQSDQILGRVPVSYVGETVKHLRHLIARAGIQARVRKLPASKSGIQVFPVAYGIEFTEEQQRTIRDFAKQNGLTCVRGIEINVERMTDPHGMNFYVTDAGFEKWLALRAEHPSIYVRRAA